MGLGDNFIKPDGLNGLYIILGRRTVNDLGGAVLTKFLVMKYETESGEVGTIFGDREAAKKCCNGNLALRKQSREATRIFLADLDARIEEQPRSKPDGDMEKVQIGDSLEHHTFLNQNLPYELKQ
ncbi:hypothetical protein PIB30_082092 [Stylosanthes scabra]|uniref:Uncharacterized protein n=1 Tax=Stylosanthes scabra TaxID=79078 RepID=A0ABU6UR96_9FABA|nr:hypothetical protein [Stylosanthes scabra]